MNKSLIIHGVVESIVIGAIYYVLNKKIENNNNIIQHLEERLKNDEYMLSRCYQQIQELTSVVNQLSMKNFNSIKHGNDGDDEPFVVVKPTQTKRVVKKMPMFEDDSLTQIFTPMMQMNDMSPASQQQKMKKDDMITNMFAPIMSLAPQIMSLATPNAATTILTQLSPNANPSSNAKVEIADDFDNDPDINEALNSDETLHTQLSNKQNETKTERTEQQQPDYFADISLDDQTNNINT